MGAPETILDEARLLADLAKAVEGSDTRDDRKTEATTLLRTAMKSARDHVATAFRANPWRSEPAIRSWTYIAEVIVRATYETVVRHFHPNHVPTNSERMAVIFAGGSGRSEMAPHSDIDLLFVTPYKQTAWGESVIETTLHILWDLKLKVGYSVRTVDDCLRLAREDITIRTNLLETSYLTGDRALTEELEQRLWTELFRTTGPEFVEGKLEERENRHKRQGGSRYLVEPNVKESKGGLRDLQTLFWIAKYVNGTKHAADLVGQGVFTQDEYQGFADAHSFLWTTRCMMHLIAGRATEQLTFDLQVEVAEALGYEARDGQRGVERFMQHYFRHARHVGELTRVFLVDLETRLVKKRPSLATSLRNVLSFQRDSTKDGFENRNGRLAVADPDHFFDDPVNILRLFEEALRTELLIHPSAMRSVVAHLPRMDDALRHNPHANEIFLNLLLGNSNPERALRRMNELGVLGAFMPEWERIDAMMQFNMYHSYTVDEHTIRCISILSQIERQELVEDLPVASGILKAGINRRVLYLALLLHDIGKGQPRPHEDYGAEIAEIVCPRLGIPSEETETVVWLVRNHLLMSDVAQKRDTSDQQTIRDFADQVRTVTNLKLLTVLTVCDIRGVGPDTWNNWKAVLIRELYAAAHELLSEGSGRKTATRTARIEAAQKNFARRVRDLKGDDLQAEIGRYFSNFWLGCDPGTQLVLSKLVRQADGQSIVNDIQMDKSRDATRACFAMEDHPGIFARLAGALALVGANVVDARTYTTSDGVAASVFWIQDALGNPYEKSRLGRLRKMIDKTLAGEVITRDALKERNVVKRRLRDFDVPTRITFDNEGSEIFTIIEVDTRDRPGLVHDLARALTASNLTISSAIIATYGNQAVDAFYVKDLFGLKIHAQSRLSGIEKRLRDAIAGQAAQKAS